MTVTVMQALCPEQGHSFLDVGSGTGYLTMVAANLVGHAGKAVGLEVHLPVYVVATCHLACQVIKCNPRQSKHQTK